MKNAASILASLFKNIGMEDRLTLACLQREWVTLFDEPLSLHTYPASLNNGILVVNVDSPLWMQQLKYFKQAMLKKLEAYRINAIEFRHGSTRMSRLNPTGKHSGTSNSEQITQPEKTLADEDINWIEQTVDTVHDPELQDGIRKAMGKALLKASKQ